jgi:mRNA interferase RelE/StbE
MDYRVELTPLALEMIAAIQDQREQQGIIERLHKLQQEPLQQGKALAGDFKGYYSIRAVGQRYRIVYQVKAEQVLVIVVGVGRRKEGDKKDIYYIAQKAFG